MLYLFLPSIQRVHSFPAGYAKTCLPFVAGILLNPLGRVKSQQGFSGIFSLLFSDADTELGMTAGLNRIGLA